MSQYHEDQANQDTSLAFMFCVLILSHATILLSMSICEHNLQRIMLGIPFRPEMQGKCKGKQNTS